MARKKNRQPDLNDSSDSGDVNRAASGPATICKHISKAVQLGSLKKKLKNGIHTSCDTCAKKTKIANIVPDVALSNEEDEIDENWSYWLCLTCAHVGCGRGQYKHAIAHYNTPRSDQHDLVVDIDMWVVWCYTCEQKMAMNSTKKLQECVEYIRRHMQTSVKNTDVALANIDLPFNSEVDAKVSVETPAVTKDLTNSSHEVTSVATSKDCTAVTVSQKVSKPSKVRGLMNLGNTCFYNSVLQCLSVTPYLTSILNKLIRSGETFSIPGAVNDESFEAPPVQGSLGDSGALTSALLDLLLEMRDPDLHADTLRPQKLLKHVQDSFPQFRNHEQHDAHELLRHLLEGVRSDDIKRFQRVILQQHSLLGRKNVSADQKRKMKLYGQQLQDLTLGVEGIFKGQLVSIVECQDCRHHSTRFESFLDLSLPVMEDKPQPPMRKKDQSESCASAPSKYQMKKQKKAAKRNHKSQKARRGEKMDGCLTVFEERSKGSDGSESEQSDADVEDNVEQDAGTTGNDKEVVESGYSSEKHNTGESDGTSPSSMNANGEMVGDCATGTAAGVTASQPGSLTASASRSPSAPASPTASASASPCQPESPTAPVSASPSGSSAGPSPAQDWATYHTPEHDCVKNLCSLKENGEMRCFTPIDEELRITIPENGEGSIHISPVNPSERSMSRRGFFPGESLSNYESHSVNSGPNFTPELESRLLSLCLTANADLSEGHDSHALQAGNICVNAGSSNNALESTITNQSVNNNIHLEHDDNANPSAILGCNNDNNDSKNNNDCDDLGKKPIEESEHNDSVTRAENVTCVRRLDGSSKENIDSTDGVSEWCKTLAQRQQTEEGECSIISCLNQFTSLELMTGNNKVGCDACTQRQNKDADGKTVYTNSTKQLLISSPPPVLILHLKRFMMDNFRFKKLQRFVSFPLILDIAPFCSTKCKDSTSFGENQSEVKYSLFGVVEHTGSLNTGHYIAYIKIRPNLGANDPRWSFLPLNREFVYSKDSAITDTLPEKLNVVEEKWFSVSDSRVVEIAEAKVLKLQAYLLFYERIL